MGPVIHQARSHSLPVSYASRLDAFLPLCIDNNLMKMTYYTSASDGSTFQFRWNPPFKDNY